MTLAIKEWYQVAESVTGTIDERLSKLYEDLNIILLDISMRLGTIEPADDSVIDTLVAPSISYTIINGGITVTNLEANKINYVFVDTEGGAATDDLDSIFGGVTNTLLLLRSTHNDRDVTLTNGTSLEIGANFTLNDTSDTILLLCKETNVWLQVTRTSNA